MSPEPIPSKAELDEIILSARLNELHDSWVDNQGHIHGSLAGGRFRALFIALDAERTLADTLASALGAAHDALRELRGGDDDDDHLVALTGNDGWRGLVDELGVAHDRYRAARQQERKER